MLAVLPLLVSTSIRGGCVVVTGASRGLGVGIARAFATEGAATVCLVARSEAGLQSVCRGLAAEHPNVCFHPVAADVTDPGGRARIVRSVESIGQRLLLVNNAGIESWGPFEHATEASVEEQVAVNLLAPMLLNALYFWVIDNLIKLSGAELDRSLH